VSGRAAAGTPGGTPGIDYDRGAAAYRSARTLPTHILDAWRAVVVVHAPRGGSVLDVGAGTGQFLRPLAEWLEARVVGVEPSAGMRAEARGVVDGRTVALTAGSAEALPLRTASVDVAWLSAVVHQFADLGWAVGELRRVVRPGGRVLVRGFFGDTPVTGVLGRFPGHERAAATFPTSRAVLAAFERAGFRPAAVTQVVEGWRFEFDRWRDRVRSLRHIDSWLRPLTDDEIEAGIRAVERVTDGGLVPFDSDTPITLLVLAG
jgi:ubiquinone/menaquinone biosynthesis C-methylase UbiE